jgi:hypothetical protein
VQRDYGPHISPVAQNRTPTLLSNAINPCSYATLAIDFATSPWAEKYMSTNLKSITATLVELQPSDKIG